MAEITVYSSEKILQVMSKKEIPSVSQVTSEAVVVLELFLHKFSSGLHKRSKKRRSDIDKASSSKVPPFKPCYGAGQTLDDADEFDSIRFFQASASQINNRSESVRSVEDNDVHDGATALHSKEHKMFCERSVSENDEILERIADELARIADNYNYLKVAANPLVPQQATSEVDGTFTFDLYAKSAITTQITSSSYVMRTEDDQSACVKNQTPSSIELVNDLVADCDYSKFERVIHQNIGQQVGFTELAQMFRLTQIAVQLAGMGSAVSNQIQSFTIRYFQDRFAPSIVEQGGWNSFISKQRMEFNSDLD